METRPLLTIAIPTYNGSKTIRDTLDVLLPQITDDIQLIISDNCSTDETPQILDNYSEKYPFIQRIKNEKNIGADGNFLRCMYAAKGRFTMLVSDDDIIIENSVEKIISYLQSNCDVSLVFMETVGFNDKYTGVKDCFNYTAAIPHNVVTTDKHVFFDYIQRHWGFTSSFIFCTDRFRTIDNPEQYFNTYWLQAYISILCSNRSNDKLGIISGPCIAAGRYGVINNYDVSKIFGVYFKQMIDFAAENGYDGAQMKRCWIWMVCYLSTCQIVKEKSSGIQLTSKKTLFKIMKKYPYAWFHLFPVFFLPPVICRMAIKIRHKIQGRENNIAIYINRPTEQQ